MDNAIKNEAKKARCLVQLVGLPCSGKSTWARNFAKRIPDCLIVSSDETRKAIFGTEEERRYNGFVFSAMAEKTEKGLAEGKTVIYDCANLSAKQRKENIAKFGAGYNVAIFFDIPLSTCLSRNAARTRHVSEDVIRDMSTRMEEPTQDEGFDAIHVLNPAHMRKSLAEYLHEPPEAGMVVLSKTEADRVASLLSDEKMSEIIGQMDSVFPDKAIDRFMSDYLPEFDNVLVEDEVAAINALDFYRGHDPAILRGIDFLTLEFERQGTDMFSAHTAARLTPVEILAKIGEKEDDREAEKSAFDFRTNVMNLKGEWSLIKAKESLVRISKILKEEKSV